jgi:surfeit locus 1 family protein
MKNLIFHCIILGTILGVAGLGAWQLQRREWKQNLIAQMDKNLILPAVTMPETVNDRWHWRQIEITANINTSRIIYVPRFHDGQWGYEIYAPIGKNLLRLGWAVAKLNNPSQQLGSIRAIIHPFGGGMNFMGTALSGNEKPHANAALYADFNLPPQDFYLDCMDCGVATLWQKLDLPNNHLQYAMTWFVLAGVLLGLYLYRMGQTHAK